MAEFKFPCPACKRLIQCDAAYVGTSVNCPLCQQAIVVPARTSSDGERVIEIKKSTLKKVGIISACVLLALFAIGLAIHFTPFGPKMVTFRASVDGTDVLKLSGKRLWIEHKAWQQPQGILINGKTWKPNWNETSSPSFPDWSDNRTKPYSLSRLFKPSGPDGVKLTKVRGRGDVTILEKPTAANHQTVAIQIDDGPYSGADLYEVTVSW